MKKAVTIQLEGDIDLTPTSAYDAAKVDGYLGTEEQYAKDMAAEPPTQEMFDAIPSRILGITKTTEKSDFHSINDSVDGKVLDFGMKGKTEQETTPGNQLFDISKFKSGAHVTNNGDGSITLTRYAVEGNNYISEVLPTVKVGQMIIVSATNSGKFVYFGGKVTGFGSSFEVTQEMLDNNLFGFYGISDVTTADNPLTISDIMINEGTTALPYEPYTNGPSPNPDYPQEIVNAGVTKNWFDVSKIVDANNYIAMNNSYSLIWIPIPSVGTYTMSWVNLNGTTPYILRAYNSAQEQLVDIVAAGSSATSKVITVEENGFYLRMLNTNIADFATYFGDVQLELGSEATDYEPYGQYKIGCGVVNKNWFDTSILYNFDSYTQIESDGSTYNALPIQLNPNTKYYVSATRVNNKLNPCFYVPETARRSSLKNGDRDVTTGDSGVLYFMLITTTNLTTETIDSLLSQYPDLQIELGAAKTEYSDFAGQIFTLTSPVPLTKWDYLTKRDGVWGWSVWSKNRQLDASHLDYTNTHGWSEFTNTNAPEGVTTFVIAMFDKAYGFANIHCGTFRMKMNGSYNKTAEKNTCSGISSGYRIFFSTDGLTIDEWKTYIDENPLNIWYQTSSEQAFHPLPDEEQTLLNNLETYYGMTNMYNDQGCPMWIKYAVDMKLYIDNKFKG